MEIISFVVLNYYYHFFSVIIDAPSDPVLITLVKTSRKAVAIPLPVASLHSIFVTYYSFDGSISSDITCAYTTSLFVLDISDRTLHQFLTITDLDLITEFDFLPNCARFP